MFVTHFGSYFNGATVWWENTVDSTVTPSTTTLTAYMYVNNYANMLIVDSSKKTDAICSADSEFLICSTLALSATTADSHPTAFEFGIVITNPDTSSDPAYDGFRTIADVSVTYTYSDWTKYFTATAYPATSQDADIVPDDADTFDTADTSTNVTVNITGSTDLCTEWW